MNNHFEGRYFKHQNGSELLSVVVGRGKDEAFIQIITPEKSFYIPYPKSAYKRKERIEIRENCFSADGITLNIKNAKLDLQGEISYKNQVHIKGDIMGPFRFLPMQCKHEIVSMNHSLTGALNINKKQFDFSGGKGYIEGDFGRSFPKSYLWVQCNHFSRQCSIVASVAHIPFAMAWFWGCICVVWLENKEYRFATYKGAKIVTYNAEKLVIVQKELTLKITFLEAVEGQTLYAPLKGKMTKAIRETLCVPASFELWKNDALLFSETSEFASYEYVPE